MVEPEVSGWGTDYGWRSGGCGVVGLVVGIGSGSHSCRDLWIQDWRKMVSCDSARCLLLEIASLRMQGRDLALY